ncbi:short chain dehydrogenase [Gymnopilus junonius]|uniref:Short chain dehydrogenase n=1 Tax=Gymnopilus junonius TaxID=109634 RepID=A0A9P5N9W4_GYMJU|nr:short chain dehydrogenase [Gymnopilus junonius]
MTSQLVWLITGTTSGLGRDLALEALKRGEKVIATGRARSVTKLDELKAKGADILELDVTAPLETLQDIAKKAVAIHGGSTFWLIMQVTSLLVLLKKTRKPQETLDQFNTNVFGALNVSRAFLPHMRERKTGTIIFIGSIAGWQTLAYAGLYSATKLVLRGISESLHAEISPLGLRSIHFEFGYFRTSFLAPGQRAPQVYRIADYKQISEQMEEALQKYNGNQPGNPLKGVEVMVDVVRGEGLAKGKPFPPFVGLGSDFYDAAKQESSKALACLEEWKDVSFSTDFKN